MNPWIKTHTRIAKKGYRPLARERNGTLFWFKISDLRRKVHHFWLWWKCYLSFISDGYSIPALLLFNVKPNLKTSLQLVYVLLSIYVLRKKSHKCHLKQDYGLSNYKLT